MKFELNGSILILFFIIFKINSISGRTIRFLIDDQQSPHNNQQINDKNEIIKRIEESNNYHRNMNELEFDYFNMLINRKKKSSSIKNENNKLVRPLPPYLYTNYQQLTSDQLIENQLNNDQSIIQHDKTSIDKIIKIDKLDSESINKTATTNQTANNSHKSSWFLALLNKFGIKLNDNQNTTVKVNVTAIKERLNYYSDYDLMDGVRVAYWLFSLFTIFTLFVTYKSYCSSRKQARHRRESEKNKRKADEQIGSRRIILPPKFNSINSIRKGSGRMSKNFVKLKSKEESSN